MGYLLSTVVKRVVSRECTVFERTSFATHQTFRRATEYGVALVVSIHHMPGSVQGKALKNRVRNETPSACKQEEILGLVHVKMQTHEIGEEVVNEEVLFTSAVDYLLKHETLNY